MANPLLPSSLGSSGRSPPRDEPRPSTPLLSDAGKEDGLLLPSYLNIAGGPGSHSSAPRPSSDRRSISVSGLPAYSDLEPDLPPAAGPSRHNRRDRSRVRETRRSPLSPDQEMAVEDGPERGRGARKVEEVQQVWGPKSQWMLFIGIGLSAYIYSLDGLTTWQYLQYATSAVYEHSLSGTIGTVQAIIIAVGKPLMAKLADVVGRAETFIIVTILYVIGYAIIATAYSIKQIAVGEIFYAFGYTGLQMLQLIVIADMTNLRWRRVPFHTYRSQSQRSDADMGRGLVTGMISAPFIINNFISAEIAQRVLPNWRLGYAMFAILIPVSLSPMIVALLWAQWKIRKAKKLRRTSRPDLKRNWSTATYNAAAEMDFIGLLLIAASLALILLPLGLLKRESEQKLRNPSLFIMMIVGLTLVPFFVMYEAKYPCKPVVPVIWLGRGPILGACLIGFLDFTSFYLQYTYLYSYVYVTREWSYRGLTYFVAIQSFVMTIFGIFGGAVMWATHRFKYMLVLGLIIRLSGCLSMLRARSPTGTVTDLIACQVLQGIGGGFAAIAIQVSAQASVAHADVATVTALVLLLSEVGNSVGSAAATGIWTAWMPVALEEHVPGARGNATLVKELFGSIERIVEYPMGDPVRDGAVQAYHRVMSTLVLAASIIAFLPPIVCLFLTNDIHLGRAQNAHDGKDLAGRSRRQPRQGSYVRLPSSSVFREEDEEAIVDTSEDEGKGTGAAEGKEYEAAYRDRDGPKARFADEAGSSSTSMPPGQEPGIAGNGIFDNDHKPNDRHDHNDASATAQLSEASLYNTSINRNDYPNNIDRDIYDAQYLESTEEGWDELDRSRSERQGLLGVSLTPKRLGVQRGSGETPRRERNADRRRDLEIG